MLLAAGLGTRLQPLTNDRPKALVELKGKTLLEIAIDNLISFGFDEIVINVHHFSEMMIANINSMKHKNAKLFISDESDLLLDTGGGIKHAAKYFSGSESFLVHNVDILSSIDLRAMFEVHTKNNAIATLAVSNRESSRYLYFDENEKLCAWKNVKTGEEKFVHQCDARKQMAFSGVHVISPEIYKYLPDGKKFSIIDVYLKLAKSHSIVSYEHSPNNFIDVGKPESLKRAEPFIE